MPATIRVSATPMRRPESVVAIKLMTAAEAFILVRELQELTFPPRLNVAEGSPRSFSFLSCEHLSRKLNRTPERLELAKEFEYKVEPVVGQREDDYRALLAWVRGNYSGR